MLNRPRAVNFEKQQWKQNKKEKKKYSLLLKDPQQNFQQQNN